MIRKLFTGSGRPRLLPWPPIIGTQMLTRDLFALANFLVFFIRLDRPRELGLRCFCDVGFFCLVTLNNNNNTNIYKAHTLIIKSG